MKKKTIKRVILATLLLVMIATIYYYYSVQATFYEGRTQYLPGTSPVFVTTDFIGQTWVLEDPSEGGTLRTLEGNQWSDHVPSGQASSIVFDHQGNIWTADGNGLFKDDGKEQTMFVRANSGLANNNVKRLAIDNSDRLWVIYHHGAPLYGSGVTVFDGTTWTTFTTHNSGLISNDVTTIAFDPENRPWFGTTDGISIYDGTNWITYSTSNSDLRDIYISSIAFDKEGQAWIATRNGLNLFNGKEWINYSLNEIGFRKHSSLLFSEIFIDSSGRIWIELGGDVRIFDGESWIGLAEEDGYDNNIRSLATDKQGNIWIANGSDLGLVVLDSEYPLATAWKTQPLRIFLASGGIVYIAFILACLLIATLQDSVAPVTLALMGGLSVFIFFAAMLNDLHVVYFPLIMNPGIYATLGAVAGTFQIKGTVITVRAGTTHLSRFMVIGFFVGLAIGVCQMAAAMLGQ